MFERRLAGILGILSENSAFAELAYAVTNLFTEVMLNQGGSRFIIVNIFKVLNRED